MTEVTVAAGADVEAPAVEDVLDAVDEKLIRQLADRARAEGLQLTGEGGLLSRLTKTVLEAALDGELDDHLGYAKHDPAGRNGANSRNGRRGKTVLTEVGRDPDQGPDGHHRREVDHPGRRSSCGCAPSSPTVISPSTGGGTSSRNSAATTSTTSSNSILPPDSHVSPKEPHRLWLASDHRPGRIRRS